MAVKAKPQRKQPLTPLKMTLDIWAASITCLVWRIASYALLNLGEDSALLAMMFC